MITFKTFIQSSSLFSFFWGEAQGKQTDTLKKQIHLVCTLSRNVSCEAPNEPSVFSVTRKIHTTMPMYLLAGYPKECGGEKQEGGDSLQAPLTLFGPDFFFFFAFFIFLFLFLSAGEKRIRE